MRKISAQVTVRVLGCGQIPNAKPDEPQFIIAWEGKNQKVIPGTNQTFTETTVERFKSFVSIEPGIHTLDVELGCYLNGSQAALYGRVLAVSSPATQQSNHLNLRPKNKEDRNG